MSRKKMNPPSEKIRKSLFALAQQLDLIDNIEETERSRGWQKKLAETLNENPAYISQWISRGLPKDKKEELAEKTGIPVEKWYVGVKYPPPEIKVPVSDAGRNTYKVPDTSDFRDIQHHIQDNNYWVKSL